MAANGPSSVPAMHRAGSSFVDIEADETVVWLSGEHDITTVASLTATMTRAIELDYADVIVDLAGVGFLDASAVGVLVQARTLLGLQSRALTVRAPSRIARRVLDACAFADVAERAVPRVAVSPALALNTWVAVPVAGRAAPRALKTVADHQEAEAPEPAVRERAAVMGEAAGA